MTPYWTNATYTMKDQEAEDRPRLVQFAHIPRHEPSAGHGGHNRYFWALDYHREPAGAFSLDGQHWQPRRARTAHLYAPETAYWERSQASDLPFFDTFIVFRADTMPRLKAKVSGSGGFALFEDAEGLLAGRFHDLFDVAAGRGGEWLAQGALFRILDALQAAQGEHGHYRITMLDAAAAAPDLKLARKVDAYLMEHYAQPLTLLDVAQALGVSRSTLTHQYRQAAGSSPMARLMRYRLESGLGMILRGDSIKAAALQTGFCDAYHFSKAFRRHFGQPPRRYLREVAAS